MLMTCYDIAWTRKCLLNRWWCSGNQLRFAKPNVFETSPRLSKAEFFEVALSLDCAVICEYFVNPPQMYKCKTRRKIHLAQEATCVALGICLRVCTAHGEVLLHAYSSPWFSSKRERWCASHPDGWEFLWSRFVIRGDYANTDSAVSQMVQPSWNQPWTNIHWKGSPTCRKMGWAETEGLCGQSFYSLHGSVLANATCWNTCEWWHSSHRFVYWTVCQLDASAGDCPHLLDWWTGHFALQWWNGVPRLKSDNDIQFWRSILTKVHRNVSGPFQLPCAAGQPEVSVEAKDACNMATTL